jgi:preprotein translocase SecE subunit
MENQRQKWVNITFGILGIITWLIASVAFSKIAAVYNLESRVKQIDMVISIGSMVLGLVLALILYFNDKSNAFMNEVVLEMSRVTWPASKDTTNATIWVILFVLLASGILWAVDSLWGSLINMLF